MEAQSHIQPQTEAPWRLKLGMAIFIVGFLSPLLIPVVRTMEMPTAWKVFISGALAVGIPEIFSIVAIAIMGKAGFNTIKESILKMFKKHGPPDEVSRTRYRIGLVMFVVPLVFGWLGPYVQNYASGFFIQNLTIYLIGDMIFIASLFVLGGDFWDKLRLLFIHGAKVDLPLRE